MIAQINHQFYRLSKKKTYTRLLSYALYEGRPLTTKGRWINPIVFALYRLQAIVPIRKKVVKPVFILGTGRSGTTILGVTLGIHRDVGFLNEPKALWSFLYDKEDLIGSYRKVEGSYRLSAANASETTVRKAHRIYGNYLRFAMASRVVDKYPEIVFRTDFVSAIFPDARFLFLFRNGYDTCHSIELWSERLGENKGGEIHDWWGRDDRKWRLLCDQIVASDDVLGPNVDEIKKYADHRYRAAVEWIVTMKEGIELMKRKPETVMGVRYEKYVTSVEERGKILKFCDLPPDARYDKYCDAVLKKPKAKQKFEFPPTIQDEFVRVMKQLGYE
jgi:hypothetical protein